MELDFLRGGGGVNCSLSAKLKLFEASWVHCPVATLIYQVCACKPKQKKKTVWKMVHISKLVSRVTCISRLHCTWIQRSFVWVYLACLLISHVAGDLFIVGIGWRWSRLVTMKWEWYTVYCFALLGGQLMTECCITKTPFFSSQDLHAHTHTHNAFLGFHRCKVDHVQLECNDKLCLIHLFFFFS